jgi:YVTN family beta-propeller protein
LDVGTGPLNIAITPDGTKAYVANFSSDTVSVIDVSTNSVLPTVIDVGPGPSFIAITPDGTKAFVTNVGNDDLTGSTVSVIDTSTDTVIATVNVELRPVGIAITQDSSKVLVSNFLSNTVSVIDVEKSVMGPSNAVIAAIPVVGPGPSSIAIIPTPDVSRAYVVNPADQSSFGVTGNTVSVVDIINNTFITTVQVGSRPIDLAIRPDGAQVFVVNYFSNTVSVIDTLTDQVITTLNVGNAPLDIAIAITPDGAKAYVANSVSETVSVIDILTDELIDTIIVIPRPSA